MTTRIASKTGNFTTAGTWMVVDSTSLADSIVNNTALSTSYQESASFTPGAITVDGIAFRVASRAAGSPSNTLTGRIALAGADVTGTVTVMNVSDIDVSDSVTNAQGGWYYLRFNVAGTPTPVTLAGATAYTVSFKLSATTTAVNLYRTATAGTDWSRMLATTTTGAPAASDLLHIMGDNLAAGTKNSYTVTMDNTATTTFGVVASATINSSLSVNKGGTLTYGTSASTNYYLRIKGLFIVYSSGTVNIGTSGTRMPSTSTATLEWDCTAAGDSGLDIRDGAVVNMYGDNARTVWSTLMTADKAATATVIALAATTGWSNGDVLGFAPTSRTASQFEKKTISTVDSSTQVTLSAGLTNARSGTSPTQAEVINLTRNVVLRSVSTVQLGYHVANGASMVNIDYVEFNQVGGTLSGQKTAFVIGTTGSGVFSYTHNSMHDSSALGNSLGINITSTATSNNITLSHNVFYNITIFSITITACTAIWVADDNTIIGNADGGNPAVGIGDVGGTLTNLIIAGSVGTAMVFGENGVRSTGTFSNWTIHSNSGALNFNTVSYDFTLSGTNAVWRSNTGGINFVAGIDGYTFNNLTMFGCNGANISVAGDIGCMIFNNFTSSGDTTFSTASGISIASGAGMHDSIINSGDFGTVTGIKTAHTQDILIPSGASFASMSLILTNTKLASAIEIANQGNMTPLSFIGSEKHDATAALHKTFKRSGTIAIETGTVHTGSQSFSMTPTGASDKLISGSFYCAVASGATVTPTVFINKSASYNGNQPRLILKRNDALGINVDTVIATYASGTGSWNSISAATAAASDDGVFEFVIDCDGTAGVVYVDSFSAT